MRTHYIVGRYEGATPRVTREALEAAIAAIVRTWSDALTAALVAAYASAGQELALRYAPGLPCRLQGGLRRGASARRYRRHRSPFGCRAACRGHLSAGRSTANAGRSQGVLARSSHAALRTRPGARTYGIPCRQRTHVRHHFRRSARERVAARHVARARRRRRHRYCGARPRRSRRRSPPSSTAKPKATAITRSFWRPDWNGARSPCCARCRVICARPGSASRRTICGRR